MRTQDEENQRRQRELILSCAWKLFREKGYEDTTMQAILDAARCSKGRFYYYFHAKNELLDSLYELFDRKYLEFYESLSGGESSLRKLERMHRFVFSFMEREIGVDLLTNLYISQFRHASAIDFWSAERPYARLLSDLVKGGQDRGEFRADLACATIVEDLIELERSQIISWCLKKGRYSLEAAALEKINRQLAGYLTPESQSRTAGVGR